MPRQPRKRIENYVPDIQQVLLQGDYSIMEVYQEVKDINTELDKRTKDVELQEKNSWALMCPQGVLFD